MTVKSGSQAELDPNVHGRVVTQSEAPRSYMVRTPSGEVRRNRQQLRIVPQPEESPDMEEPAPPEVAASPPGGVMTRSRTGSQRPPPDRFGW